MAEVRIPTILRAHTGGERVVAAAGATVAEIITDLEANHTGIAERILENGEVRRFVNIYVNDEDIRFTGGLTTAVGEAATVVILPAVAGGAAEFSRAGGVAKFSRAGGVAEFSRAGG